MKHNKFISFSPYCIHAWILDVQLMTHFLVMYAPEKSVNKATYLWFRNVLNKRASLFFFVCNTNTHFYGSLSGGQIPSRKLEKLPNRCSTISNLNWSGLNWHHLDGANTLSCNLVSEMHKLILLHPFALLMVH